MLKTRIFAATLLMLGLFSASHLAADDKATDFIPAKTLAVVRIKNPSELVEKGAGFVDALQPGMGAQVRKVADAMGQLIDNPTLAGVSKDDAWWVAVQIGDEKSSTEQPLFIVPLLKGHEEDLPKALGDGYQYARKGNWGIYTKDKQTFEVVQKLLKGDGKSITSLIGDTSGKVFGDGDVSVFLSLGQIIADHRDDFVRARAELARELNQSAEHDKIPGVDIKAAVKAVSELFNGVIQGMEDTRTLVVAVQVSKQGILLEDLLQVAPDSATDKFLQGVQTAPISLLSQLPKGQQAYFGAKLDFSKLFETIAPLLSAPAAGQEKKTADLKRLLLELAKLKFGSMSGAIKTGSVKDGFVRVSSVVEVDSPEKARSISNEMYKSIGEFEDGKIKQSFKLEADAEKYDTHTADVLTVKISSTEESLTREIDKMFKMIYGPEGTKARIVYLKDRVLQTLGGGRQTITDTLEAMERPAETNSPVNKARAQLPASANMIVLLDVASLIRNAALLAIESGVPVGRIPAAAFEGVKLEESYLAASVGAESHGLRGRLYLPIEQVKGLARLALSTQILEQMGFFAGGRN